MKIMHISNKVHPCFWHLIKDNKESERTVEVVFAKLTLSDDPDGAAVIEQATFEGVNHISIKNIKKDFSMGYDAQIEKIFLQLLVQHKPDIVHIQYFGAFNPLPILNVCSSMNIKKIITLHDHSLFCAKGTYSKNNQICGIIDTGHCNCSVIQSISKQAGISLQTLNYLRKQQITNISNQLDKIICPSKSQKDLLVRLFDIPEDKIRAVHYGLELAPVDSAKVKKNNEIFTFGYIGSLIEVKGVQTILDAMGLIPDKDVRILMALIHKDDCSPYEKDLIKRIGQESRITIIKNQKREDLYDVFFSKIDYLIIPSTWQETGPLTIFESFLYKTPVIINNIDSMLEKVKVGKNAIAFSNTEELASIISDLIDKKESIKSISPADTDFSVKDAAKYREEINTVYDDTTKKNPIRLLSLKLGLKCNSNCEYCVTGDNFPRYDADFNEIKKYLLEHRKKYNTLLVTGGEPTIKKSFFDVLAIAFNLGYKIHMQTNARVFKYKEFCDKIKKYNIRFSISVNGPNPEIHDKVSAVKGSFDQTVQGIKNLVSKGSDILCKIVLTKNNYRHMLETAGLIVNLGIKNVWIVFPTPYGHARTRFDYVVPKYDKIKSYLKNTIDFLEKQKVHIGLEAFPYCILDPGQRKYATEIMYLNPKQDSAHDGLTMSCSCESYDVKNWRIEQKTKFSQCKDCTHNAICEGIYKNYSDKRGSGEFSPITEQLSSGLLKSWKDYHSDSEREEGDEPMKPDLPEEVVIEVTSRCNLRCGFCFNKHSFAKNRQRQYQLSGDMVKKIVQSTKKAGVKIIRFTGGEPLMHENIFELLEFAKRKGLKVWLNTNGTLIDQEKAMKIAQFVENVLVPINSYTDEKESKITGCDNALLRRIDSVKILKSAGVNTVRVGTIATRDNIQNLDRIFEIINKISPDSWELYRPMGDAHSLSLSKQDVQILVDKLIDIKNKTSKIFPIANALPYCAYDREKVASVACGTSKYDDGHARFVIDPKGYAKPSYYLDKDIGKPEEILSCWNNPFMKKIRSMEFVPHECKSCEYIKLCRGGSRFSAWLATGKYDGKDPLHT